MNAKLTIDGHAQETTLSDFLKANADGMDKSEMAKILRMLLAGWTYHGGGGGEPEWTLEPAAIPIGLDVSGASSGARQVTESFRKILEAADAVNA